MGMESRGGTIRKKKLGELLCEKAYLDESRSGRGVGGTEGQA